MILCLHVDVAKCFKLPFESNEGNTENVNLYLLHCALFSSKAALGWRNAAYPVGWLLPVGRLVPDGRVGLLLYLSALFRTLTVGLVPFLFCLCLIMSEGALMRSFLALGPLLLFLFRNAVPSAFVATLQTGVRETPSSQSLRIPPLVSIPLACVSPIYPPNCVPQIWEISLILWLPVSWTWLVSSSWIAPVYHSDFTCEPFPLTWSCAGDRQVSYL